MKRITGELAAIIMASTAACGSSAHDAHDGPDAGKEVDAAPDAYVSSVEAIPLTTPDGSYYNVDATFGAGQPFELDLDTGSTTIGVAGKTCSACGVEPLYAPATTAVDMHGTAQTQYADGSGWAGEIFSDMLGLGHGTPNVKLSFVSITQQEGGFFSGATYQGIMGLGPQQLLEDGTTAYVPAATTAGAPPIMGFELCASHGNMWFGGFDASAGQGAMQYTPMPAIDDNNPFYAIDVDDITLGGTALGLTVNDFQEPIIDTGTSLWYVPTKVHTAVVNAVNSNAAFKALFPGQTISDDNCVQSSNVTAAQVDAMLPALALNLPAAGGPDISISAPPTASYLFDGGGGQFCLAINDGGDQDGATFGDAFIRGYLTVIDVQNGRVGFATDAGCAASGDANRRIDRRTFVPHRPHPHPRTTAARR